MEFIESLKNYLDQDFIDDLLISLKENKVSSLLLNTNKISNQIFLEEFKVLEPSKYIKNAYYYDPQKYQFGKSYLFDNGAYYIMDISSMMSPSFFKLNKNDLVLDMCAAPGGKTIFLALNNPSCYIVANDISFKRALNLSSNIERMGLSNVMVTFNDFKNNYLNFKERFDAILLDAPCSGSAMFRKNELVKEDWSYQKVLNLQIEQKELIKEAIFMLKDGGELIYSTCSFSYEEDEEVIQYALDSFLEMELIDINNDPSFFESNKLKGTIHLFPNRFKGEGQFIAKMRKKGSKILKNSDSKKEFKPSDYDLKYRLDFRFKNIINNEVYESSVPFYDKRIHILRNGLDVGLIKKDIFIPSFHLAHYLSTDKSIKLTEEQKIKYIHGDIIEISEDLDGFFLVSYKGINLGFIKAFKGKGKNYYPKGLRH